MKNVMLNGLKVHMKRYLTGLTVVLLSAGFCNINGQDLPGEWDFFGSDSVLELTMHLDMDSLLSDIGEDPAYHNAVLAYMDPRDRSPVEISVDIRARGNFRKNPANCDFPPLKMKFDKPEREGTLFGDIKDLKLVTHCQGGDRQFEQYLLEEYLLYRTYNLLTDFSFRVRLARITYEDRMGVHDPLTRFAFFLENPEDMAERNRGVLLNIESVEEKKLDRVHLALMCIFNYMILNTDYSIGMVHNMELISVNYFEPPIPVPYDFDWSGIINIPYDSPYANNKTRYTRRRYKGPCLKRKELEPVLLKIKEKREELYRLFADFPYLEEELKIRSQQELDMFFILIGSRRQVREEFIKNCKK